MAKTLRTQFMDHMTLNRFSPWTIKNYMDTMRRLAKYYNKSPDLISQEEIQEYLLYLLQKRKLSWGTCNTHLSGLACFYKNVLKWDERKFKLPPRPRVKKLPNVMSVEEVKRLFESAANLKHRVLLKTVYSAGLRISEVVKLKPRHIESDPSRMMIRIDTPFYPNICLMNSEPTGKNINPANGFSPVIKKKITLVLLPPEMLLSKQKKSRYKKR